MCSAVSEAVSDDLGTPKALLLAEPRMPICPAAFDQHVTRAAVTGVGDTGTPDSLSV